MKRCHMFVCTAMALGLTAGTGSLVRSEEPTRLTRPVQMSGPATFEQEVITMRENAMKVWPFDDLRARGFDIPEVAREDNAFWTYLEAINAYKDEPSDLRPAFNYAITTAWPAEHGEQLNAFLLDKDNQKALALVRQAAQREQFQLYYFGDPQGSIISVLLPSLKDYRTLGRLLVADGRRLEAQGAYDLALRNYTAAMRMGHHVAGGITLIENLVGIAVWALADQAALDMVLRRDLPAVQLEEILDQLNTLAPLCPQTLSGMRNERIMGTTMVDELTARPFQLHRNLNALNGGPSEVGTPLSQQDGWRRLEARIGRLLLPDRTMKAHLNDHYDQLIDRAGKPAYAARWDEFDEGAAVMAIPQWDVFSRMMLPSLTRANLISERCRMQSRATRLAVALRLYTLEHDGEAPGQLADLAEWLPADEWIDPFSGKPFVYDHREQAWRFYSLSENFADDGGQEEEGNRFELDYVVRFPVTEIKPFEPADEENTEP